MTTLTPKLTKVESWLIACLSPLLIMSLAFIALFPGRTLGDSNITEGSYAALVALFVPVQIVSMLCVWGVIALSWNWWQAIGRLTADKPAFCFDEAGIAYTSRKITRHYRWEEFDHILLHQPHYLRLSFKLKSEKARSFAALLRRLFFVRRIPPLNEPDTNFEFEPILEYLDKYAPTQILRWKLRLKKSD